jgi:hypothetical protein
MEKETSNFYSALIVIVVRGYIFFEIFQYILIFARYASIYARKPNYFLLFRHG